MAQAANRELIAELQEVIDALGRCVIDAQQDLRRGVVRPERVNAMFRHGHTLKGLFGMAGHKGGQRLAHSTEDLLESMRMGRAATSSETLALLLDCVDHFSRAVDSGLSAHSEAALEALVEPLMGRLQALFRAPSRKEVLTPPQAIASAAVPEPTPAPAPTPCHSGQALPAELRRMLTEYEEYRFEENMRAGRHLMAAAVSLSLMDCDVALPKLEHELGALGEIIARLPSAQIGADGSIAFDILVAADSPAATVEAQLGRADVVFKPLHAGSPPAVVEAAPKATQSVPSDAPRVVGAPLAAPTDTEGSEPNQLAKPTQTVRVDIRRLDHLMHLVGELGTTRNVLARLATSVRQTLEPQTLAAELEREGTRLERRISMLQAQVLEARMVPLSTLFDRLVRAGTKVALELGIEAQFVTVGGQTELDKRIVEELADPLLHLMRNAIDHGLEKPEVRAQHGKPACGTVKLWAEAHGSHVVVGVGDDGGGIDADQVGHAALARSLVTSERLAEMSVDERLRLILLPGFSTRDEVSEYSGRGVGLDVVKTHLERLGGGVEIATQGGVGSSFTLMAPVTLAIMPALVVMAAGKHYAIPLAHVVETVGIEAPMVSSTQGLPTLHLRNQTLTLTALGDMLGQGQTPTTRQSPGSLPYAVIVGLASRQTAIAVCDVVGQKDIVIKPLGPRLSHIRGLSGAAQIDDGALVLVLDVLGLTHTARGQNAATGLAASLGAPRGGTVARLEAP